jgi:metal-responsive CopG/Arc/MetJ family transcriptional regulator
MLLKGKTKAIKAIADGLIAAKGVRQGKLVLTTTRKEK